MAQRYEPHRTQEAHVRVPHLRVEVPESFERVAESDEDGDDVRFATR